MSRCLADVSIRWVDAWCKITSCTNHFLYSWRNRRFYNRIQCCTASDICPLPFGTEFLAILISPKTARELYLYESQIYNWRYYSVPRTKDYVARRTTEGLSTKEIARILKRYIARELFHLILKDLSRLA